MIAVLVLLTLLVLEPWKKGNSVPRDAVGAETK